MAFIPQLVEASLREAIESFPEEMQEILKAKFAAYYENPETAHVEHLLRKRITDTHAQQLLFTPTKDQAGYYVMLVQPPPEGAPMNHPCHIVCQRYLAMWYLRHAQIWSLAQEFILNDGLNALVNLFDNENIHFRGQALDSFTQLTSNPDFDWFEAPKTTDSKSMHIKMLMLTETSDIIKSLTLNKDNPALSYCALQILAFYMSWVRKLYTKGELRLSTALLHTLLEWKSKAEMSDEERTLALNVFEDFNRWPAADVNKQEDQQQKPKHVFKGVEYPEGSMNLKKADDAISALDFDTAIQLCNQTVDLTVLHDLKQAYGLRAKARLMRKLDRVDLKRAVEDFSSALELEMYATTEMFISHLDMVIGKASALVELNMHEAALTFLKAQRDTILAANDLEEIMKKIVEVEASHMAFLELMNHEKQLKENTIYEAIMNRRNSSGSGDNNARHGVTTMVKVKSGEQAPMIHPGVPKEEEEEEKILLSMSLPLSVKKKKNNNNTKSSNQAAASFMNQISRKLIKSKQRPELLAKVLATLSGEEIEQVIPDILSPEMLVRILKAMQLDLVKTNPVKASEIMDVLRNLPKYNLVLELADNDVQELAQDVARMMHI